MYLDMLFSSCALTKVENFEYSIVLINEGFGLGKGDLFSSAATCFDVSFVAESLVVSSVCLAFCNTHLITKLSSNLHVNNNMKQLTNNFWQKCYIGRR